MTDRTAPADPREALRRYLDPDGCIHIDNPEDMPEFWRRVEALAARQDEPSPALRSDQIAAIEAVLPEDGIAAGGVTLPPTGPYRGLLARRLYDAGLRAGQRDAGNRGIDPACLDCGYPHWDVRHGAGGHSFRATQPPAAGTEGTE